MAKNKPVDTTQISTAVAKMETEIRDLLASAGVEPQEVSVPDVQFATPVTLAELCEIEWEKYPKALISPPMVVKRLQEFPEADQFEGYKGFVRVEANLPGGELIAFTTHLFNKTSGEIGPIAGYLRGVKLPALMRVGQFETSTPNRKVFRPVPVLEP